MFVFAPNNYVPNNCVKLLELAWYVVTLYVDILTKINDDAT